MLSFASLNRPSDLLGARLIVVFLAFGVAFGVAFGG